MAEPEARRGAAPVVTTFLVLNVVVFLLWMVLGLRSAVMMEHFLISWRHLAAGRVWTLLTAVFSHNLLFHLLVNMVVLMSFGPPLERALGSGRFATFYLVAGVVGSLAHAVVSGFVMEQPGRPALGASSALAGVLLLFSFAFPRATVLLFFLIPMPAIAAALLFVGIDVWGLFMQIEGEGGWPIGHGAHLGGALTGIVYSLAGGRPRRE